MHVFMKIYKVRKDVNSLIEWRGGGDLTFHSLKLMVRAIILRGYVIPRYVFHILAAVVIVIGIYGCDSNDGTSQTTSPTVPPNQSAKEKLEALENSGAIPKLERTDSVAGIDANANGVRDDVEAYIATHYSNPAQRAAVLQFAAVTQAAMVVDKADLAAAKAISVRVDRAINCLYSKFEVSSGAKHPAAVGQEIESISTNTKKRLLAYLAFSKALDGTVGTSSEGDTCE